MEIVVKTKRCNVPARVKEEARSRVEHATRFYGRLSDVEVIFTAEVNRRIADGATVEVVARTNRRWIRAEACAPDHRAAMEAALARFERQLSRHKTRRDDRHHGRSRHGVAARRQPAPALPLAAPAPAASGVIAETMTVDAPPMLPEDAADEMVRTQVPCLMFTNVLTGACSVLFRRETGDIVCMEAVPSPAMAL